MILKGNERGYGAELARHLMNARDNDHVSLHSLKGFVADDLFGAFAEAEAISQATQCQKFLFSLSLNPPPDEEVSVEQFEQAVAHAEAQLGLSGQPRAIVFHEKNGRRHAHAVWSRIDGQKLRAINLPHYKRKLHSLSRELYRTHDWDMPEGFRDVERRDPQNYSREEAGQAKREKRDPKAIKAMFRACWAASDSKAGFEAALQEQGFVLARGDRRGFVAVDSAGKVWSLSRWCGVSPKDMRAQLGPEMDLPSVQDVSDRLQDLPKQPAPPSQSVFEARRAKLLASQRAERAVLLKAQENQRVEGLKARQRRLPKGLRALLSRATGQYHTLVQRLEDQAHAATRRDRAAQKTLITKHLNARQALAQEAQTRGVTPAFLDQARPDPRQALRLHEDALPFAKAQILKSPDLILDHISQTKAAFKRVDVLRALAQKIDDPMQLQQAADQAMKSPQLVRLPDDGSTPVFTTQDYQAAERSLGLAVQSMTRKTGFAVRKDHMKEAVKTQNAKMQRAFGGQLSAEQRVALAHVLGDLHLSSVVGLAGAGKSTLLATARDAWARQGVTVHGAALAGKAAEELQTASGITSRTLASLEMSWKNGYDPIAKGEVLVVDEAGMIGTRQLAQVASKVNEIGAKLVLVGDPDQLQPIEAGTPFRQVTADHGAARLTEIHRQKEDWQKQASLNLAAGDVAQAVDHYRVRNAVTQVERHGAAIDALVETYAMDVATNGTDKSRLAFAHKRKDVHALNQAIRSELRADPDATPETLFATETGNRAFAADDRLVFTRNDKGIGVKNGMLGIVIAANVDEVSVALDGDTSRLVSFDPRDFGHFDHGYAVTIHKSQGATVDHGYVLASRSMDRHLAYVAMTRHREEMRLFISAEDRPSWASGQQRRMHPSRVHAQEGPSMN